MAVPVSLTVTVTQELLTQAIASNVDAIVTALASHVKVV
jgi:hypothetical protein